MPLAQLIACLRAAERRELLFERCHFRAEDELAMLGDARNRFVDLLAEPAALRGKIDEGNRLHVDTGVLVHRCLSSGPDG